VSTATGAAAVRPIGGETTPAGSAPSVAPARPEPAPPAGSLTVAVPVAPTDALRDALREIDDAIKTQSGAPLARVRKLHVARWVLLPARVRDLGVDAGAALVMWTVFDGDERAHVAELVGNARAVLDRIYAHCAGYPVGGDAAAVEEFLLRHQVCGPVAPFDGTPGRSLAIIHQQNALAEHLAMFVRERKSAGMANRYVFLEAQRFVDTALPEPLATFARTRFVLRKRPWFVDAAVELLRTIRGAGTHVAVLAALATAANLLFACVVGLVLGRALGLHAWTWLVVGALVMLLPAALTSLTGLLWMLFLWRTETREALRWVPVPDRMFKNHHEILKQRDNEGAGMNRMTILTDVKPGFMRHVTLHAVLGIIAFRARRNHAGVLEGVETIHFAEWRLVDEGRRLLFMTNYDGDALGYLFDFSHNAAPGVNAIWGNTEGFPPTRNLIGEGSRNVEAFQNAARVHQIPTDVWYCGYATRRFSVARINANWRIHELLNAFPTPSEVDEWVGLLERRRA